MATATIRPTAESIVTLGAIAIWHVGQIEGDLDALDSMTLAPPGTVFQEPVGTGATGIADSGTPASA